MAFKNGLSERLDELRFPSPRSPPSESAYNPLSPGNSNFSGFSRPTSDVRANLQRRFTTDSSKLSSWNFLNQGPPQAPDPLDLLSSFEKKRQHIEYMREQKRRFEEDMKLLDIQHEKEKIEMAKLARDLAKAGIAGRASEPTTPPEYREPTVSSAGRAARFPSTSVTSSPGFFSAFAPSTLTSPQPQAPSHSHAQSVDRFSAHSLPGSRRNSEKENFLLDSTDSSTMRTSSHRNSMPSSNNYTTYRPNMTSNMSHLNGYTNSNTNGYMNGSTPAGFESFSVARHLFQDDEGSFANHEPRLSTPDLKTYITMTEPIDDKFPTLHRNGSNFLAAYPDAHDLASPRAPGQDTYSYRFRNHASHQSMPQSLTDIARGDRMNRQSEDHGVAHRHHARHSLEGGLAFPIDSAESTTPVASHRPVARVSYSTNDVPTIRGTAFDAAITPPRTHTDQIHHRNVSSVGRIPTSLHHLQTRGSPESENHHNQSGQTTLQASAAPFGPHITSTVSNGLNGSIAPMSMQFPAFTNSMESYGPAPTSMMVPFADLNTYGAYSNPVTNGYRTHEAAGRGGHTLRRATESEVPQQNRFDGQNRFTQSLDHYKGELYSLCKDQHGCRYLQRKLDENNAEYVKLIFNETYMHVTELMTDPFGNYLVQKLLELSNDDQRTLLINNAAPQMVSIALNQHGTRALQKMIEHITTPGQTQTVIDALANHVVDLVKDLNGNHVIQKCLNRLHTDDANFIYEAVGGSCIIVGTHRHGCCVLQRCIDHASGSQKTHLIAQITDNSFKLIQDPYGNYVVQYILDLGVPAYTKPLCQGFYGHILQLSMHKFSSNVIEKCLRTCSDEVRREMIDEMLSGDIFADCLRHQYGNYVIQTALENADPEIKPRLMDAIRPILPSIRQTPHGRRIAGKMAAAEASARQVQEMMKKDSALENFAHQNFPPTPAASSKANTPPGAGNNDSLMFPAPGSPGDLYNFV